MMAATEDACTYDLDIPWPIHKAGTASHSTPPERRPGAVQHRAPEVRQRCGVADAAVAEVHGDERVLHDLLGGAAVIDE